MKIPKLKSLIHDYPQVSKRFLLRWEITRKCNVGCKHCLRVGDTPKRDLSYDDCLKILESLRKFVIKNNLNATLGFTGGDPLLRKDFLDILASAIKYQQAGIVKNIIIEGNPDCINKKTVKKLKNIGVMHYKFSIDGLKKTHDSIRKKGSFQETIKALKCLQDAKIKTTVKFTVSRFNSHELLDTIRLMVKENVSSFLFTQFIPMGGGASLKKDVLTPKEYRKVLMEVLSFLDTLSSQYLNFKDLIFRSEHLFARLFYELDRWEEYKQILNRCGIMTGCDKGLVMIVLPDGAVRARRYIPEKIGQLPRDSFQKIYENSGLLRSLEDHAYIERRKKESKKCRECPVGNYCGHMLGDAYWSSGSPYGANPMCWVE